MFKKMFICIFLFNFMLLTGCATVRHMPLSMENRQVVRTIYVNPEIKKPERMYEFVSGAEFGMGFGLIGGLVSGVMNDRAALSTQQFAEKNKIDIRQIVSQRWKDQITEKSRFTLANQPADAVLTTDIVIYGISIPHGFSTDYVPVLTLNAKLVRKNQIIWQDSGFVLSLSGGLPRYKMHQLLNDPKKLYFMWDKAAEKIINKMLNDMNK